MRSFGVATLLFALAFTTECLAAHSERSRQRSGPIRSVPVGADIKRDADFDCPEEFGYYPHPTDCTLYYVCVFGGALLESCTGGLMYSHELQTCDWPRNVGCDGTSAVGGDEFERLSEREPPPPPPPPPRRTPPPPPPRVQPNPIVTSRGQPKFNREEYEKQLYAEVDDLPPVEEIESDRQQRVHRGQPPTIGQVQKDRDGYGSQVVSTGRNLNSNIIPASISQNSGKFGSFSFGTQTDERRSSITQAPQSYSEVKPDKVTELHYDRLLDIETNEINDNDVTHKAEKLVKRKKRYLDKSNVDTIDNITKTDTFEKRSDDGDDEMEYFEADNEHDENIEDNDDEYLSDDSERGKRQVRYYVKNGYNNGGKIWGNAKPIKLVDYQQFNYNPSVQNARYQSPYNGLNNNNMKDATRKPYFSQNLQSTANPFAFFQTDNSQPQRPFKPSLPDPTKQKVLHSPINPATQIITKSPPISSLKNDENPFSALAGGFYNNAPKQINSQVPSPTFTNHHNNHVSFPDSSLLPSTVVTGKPIPTSSRNQNKLLLNAQHPLRGSSDSHSMRPPKSEEYDNDDQEDDDDDVGESSEEDSDDEEDEKQFNYDFAKPPYEFTHPKNKFANIDNPFAHPDFDFDAFLTKLRDDHYVTVGITTPKPKDNKNTDLNKALPSIELTTKPNINSDRHTSTLNYKGMSTPKPFTVPTFSSSIRPVQTGINGSPPSKTPNHQFERLVHRPQHNIPQNFLQNSELKKNESPQQNAGISLDNVRPKLKPPNFSDDRQLPINYNFNRPLDTTVNPNHHQTQLKGETTKIVTVTQKPYIFITSTGRPIILSTPKQQYIVKPDKILSWNPHLISTGKPYFVSTVKPHNGYITFKHSTPTPITTLVNEQLSALQHYWRNPSTESQYTLRPSIKPTSISEIPKLESLFVKPIRPSVQIPVKNQNSLINAAKDSITTTTISPPKRRPIPKPSPEMNDYYYDDDDNEYYEPPVKPKYMPSSEVRPQRPPMAQNYQEYDDYENPNTNTIKNPKYQSPPSARPAKYRPFKQDVTKNSNDVSVSTKGILKDSNKNSKGKIPVPVMVTPSANVLIRPEVSNYEIVHHMPRNHTIHIRKPTHFESGPHTVKPPKYLNQTTLRPYTIRHRLAKPTTVKDQSNESEESKQQRGKVRHHNIVAQMKFTTPRDSHKQETRYTKSKHDDKTNSLEPTESVSPASYSASPRPKMLYNGSQNYTPEQYDPYYPVYDEDSELYKDTDYVQQYNVASLRPAVQQTYRGTPPPARRPVETYTPRPLPDEYDDALIQGQINTQNQYQTPIRHSTRGEGNELGYDHNPSSVRTIYEATPISTTPSTTSTSTTTTTTTQRPTAPFTEAMIPSRHSPRSSTDETPKNHPESSTKNPSDGSPSQVLSTSLINLSSLAKPFEKTDNSHRLRDSLTPTEKLPTRRLSSRVTNKNNNDPVEVVRQPINQNNKTVVSLTTGFSIRRNLNNTNNPYTLTVITRPFDNYEKSRNSNHIERNAKKGENRYYYNIEDSRPSSKDSKSSERRSDTSSERIVDEDDIPVYVRPSRISSTRFKTTYKPKIQSTTTPTTTTKYYLKTVIKRPAPFSLSDEKPDTSTENIVDTEAIIEAGIRNTKLIDFPNSVTDKSYYKLDNLKKFEDNTEEPFVSPFKTLSNLRTKYDEDVLLRDHITSTASTTQFSTTSDTTVQNAPPEKPPTAKNSYYSYRVVDEADASDHTTEIFNGKVKNVIKAFFGNLVSTSKPETSADYSRTTLKPSALPEERVVNIGFTKKMLRHFDETPSRQNKRLQIIKESTPDVVTYPTIDSIKEIEADFKQDFSSMTTSTTFPLESDISKTTPVEYKSSNFEEFKVLPSKEPYQSKFTDFVTSKSDVENSRFIKFLDSVSSTPQNNPNDVSIVNNDKMTKLTNINGEIAKTSTETEDTVSEILNEIVSTTSTTKATTVKTKPTTTTTKGISYPTRASRVNPAIKLAATNPGSGRRSYQSSSKCSSDNSLQANPKCNEIKYQRPSAPTRGRGSAHYSTLSGSEAPQQTPNRGTPPTRSRPTLKPSTAIVSKSTEFVDIYLHPPTRPAPVYPQPTPDKTAAKCRKDVCLLPDCYCGGKDIPGELSLESIPQIVLLTFDDSVNDLNKGLYADLFEKGRVNPNGCPISATFYVSHEWTDYSQVQNLYSAGHEMASHTVSHSFGEQFSQKKWNREVGGQREILAAYGGVKLEDVRGMRAPFLSVGGNKMFKMLYDSNFTYDSSLPVYENRPPSWPYTLDYKLFHDCMIPPCPTKSYPGVWEVPMVMWQDLNGGRCSMGDACANPPDAEGVYKMILKNFDRHYTTNRAPFGLYYHAAWFTHPHHKEGFIMFLDFINSMKDVWIVTNWQALQWVRDPTPINRINNFQPFQCNYQDRPKKCNNPKVCNLWHKSGVRYMRSCQPCPEIYPWTGKTGIRSSRIDNDIDE